MSEFIALFKMFDLHTILPLGGLIWYLNHKLENRIHEDIKEIKEEMSREFKFINIRLSRVEGTVYGKDIYKSE